MKLKDLQRAIEDGADVAVVSYRPKIGVPHNATRAQVVAVKQPRRVTSNRSTFGHLAEDGVRVRPVNGHVYGDRPITGSAGYRRDEHDLETDDRVVAQQAVYGTWDDYVAQVEAADEAKRSRRQRLDDQRARGEAAAEALGGRVAPIMPYRGGGIVGYRLELDVSQAERLVERLERS